MTHFAGLKRAGCLLGALMVIGGIVAIYLIATEARDWSAGKPEVNVDLEIPAAVSTEMPTEAPTISVTTEPTSEPTEEPTEQPTEAPTEEPTEVPTVEPTSEPTEEPTTVPTPEPEASIQWQVVEADTNRPINQARVWLAFNQHDPAQLLFTDESGNVTYDFASAPNLGENGRGYVVFQSEGLEKTEIWFRLDESSRRLVLVGSDGLDLDEPVKLFTHVEHPSTWDDSQVWAGCETEECMAEIALTSGYFQPGQAITCQSAVIDSTHGTEQRFRAANGLSVVESTAEHYNFVGPQWPQGGSGLMGWQCGNEEETIIIASGCGNIAQAVKPN